MFNELLMVHVLKNIFERYFFILQEFYTSFKVKVGE